MTDFSLTIMGNDWIVIAFVALVMFLGTKRMPEASRKLGKIMGEFNKTKSTVQKEIQMAKGDFGIPVQGPVTTERQKLELMAKTLGIDSANKTDDDLRNQISSKLGSSPVSGQSSKQKGDSAQQT
ncbi:MAG TPA: twin-arginine translocase TatA/TatE family subunit [Candidatus Nitrosotalea sp.]|nr:twin-arginine translocase TatA/TatE family subunit [Candidatus Nitrosotalea sp.]